MFKAIYRGMFNGTSSTTNSPPKQGSLERFVLHSHVIGLFYGTANKCVSEPGHFGAIGGLRSLNKSAFY